MPPSIPEGLTAKHVLLALKDLDSGIEHNFKKAVHYELVHDGRLYPPKAVVGIAFRHLTGSILEPHEFSGGQKSGQANHVLDKLGFTVQRKQHDNAYITSRRSLPDKRGLEDVVWFNMWEKRNWPYHDLEVNNVLFWYDSASQAVVWKSMVSVVERFEYNSKKQVREWFKKQFKVDPVDDPYYVKAKGSGYCLAYKVTSAQPLSISKPADYKFPFLGWLRCSDSKAEAFVSQLLGHRVGKVQSQLDQIATELEDEGYFEPQNLEDERKKRQCEIVQRQGQKGFRSNLIAAYGGCCAVTGADAKEALHAAHVVEYLGPETNHVNNGLLLRADIHTLFDQYLIGINPDSLTVVIAGELEGTCYEEFDGQPLACPSDSAKRPSKEALRQRWDDFCDSE